MFKKNHPVEDPLHNPKFSAPGFLEKLRDVFLGSEKPLDTVQIEVTSHCAGNCSYCPHTTMADRWHSRHMKAETLASLWPLLQNAARAHLQGWGEPFLHPRFFDFVQFAIKAGCQTSTTSCGTNLNDETMEKIIKSGLDTIAFSLVGTDAESNAPRSSMQFDEVCAAIRNLGRKIKKAGKGPEIHIAYLLLADRIDAAANLPELMEQLEVNCAVVSTLDYLAVPQDADLAFGPHETEKIRKAAIVLEAAAEQVKLNGKTLIYALPDPLSEPPNGCRENVRNSLYVDAEGGISPCVYLNVPAEKTDDRNLAFGNSLEENVWEIWRKPEYRDFRESLIAGHAPPACQSCPKRRERVSF